MACFVDCVCPPLNVAFPFSDLALFWHSRSWRFFYIFGLGVFLGVSDLAFFWYFRTWRFLYFFGLGVFLTFSALVFALGFLG